MQSHPFPSTDLLAHNVSASGRDFISSLMVALPDWRLTAEAALTHQWISRYLPSAFQSSSSSPMTRVLPATHSINEVFANWNTLSISDSPPPDLTEKLRPERSGNYQPVGGSSNSRLTQREHAATGKSTDPSTKSQVYARHTLQPEYVAPSTHTSRRLAPGSAFATAPPSSYQQFRPNHPPIDTSVRSKVGPGMPPPSRSGKIGPRSLSGPQYNHSMVHPDWVSSVAFSPNGATIASSSGETVSIWDAGTKRQLRKFSAHNNEKVSCVVFSPDGATIATGSENPMVRIWDAGTGKQLQELSGHTSTVKSVAFSPDGATIASGSSDRTIKIWSRAGGMLRELRDRDHDVYISSVAFSPDSTTIASDSMDTSVSIWNVTTGQQLWNVQKFRSGSALGCVAFSPDGAALASISGYDVKIWDVGKGTQVRELRGHMRSVTCVAFSPNGASIASGSLDLSVRIWDASTGVQLRELRGHKDVISSLAFSPNGATIASGSADRTVRIWDVGTR
jgi:WD40 repeat protein